MFEFKKVKCSWLYILWLNQYLDASDCKKSQVVNYKVKEKYVIFVIKQLISNFKNKGQCFAEKHWKLSK